MPDIIRDTSDDVNERDIKALAKLAEDKHIDQLLKETRGGRPCSNCDD